MVWDVYLGCFSTLKSVKKLSPGGSSFFTLPECLEASRVHGSHNPVRKPFGIPLFYWAQGRRKLLKVREGGQALRGTFRKKKGNRNIFSTGGGSSQKNFPDIPKKLSGYILNMKTFFRIYQKISRIYDIFSGKENNIDSCFQKCPLGKKNAILMTFFMREKGTWQNLGWGGDWPPGSYAPDLALTYFCFLQISTNVLS
jgi:hypothetical protein